MGAGLLSAVAMSAFAAQPVLTHAQGAVLARAHKPGGSLGGKPRKAPMEAPAPAAAGQPKMLPARRPFTAAEDATATIPGMAGVRFWADSTDDFVKALPEKPGPWLTLSSGGSDGAFGAGLLNGLSASGKRPDYAVVTGVSTGALIAPFVFAGPRYDNALHDAFTKISAADIFEINTTPESFLDTWPLKDLIAKQVTPALIADIAAQYRAGRRLFIVTTNLDAERSMVWNMGAIAARGDAQAIKLFRTVLLASCSIPGAFPPVFIDVESGGNHFSEMHVDGGVGGQFFVAPAALMAATSDFRLPATALYVVVDTGLQPAFDRVERTTAQILAQSVGMAVKVDTRLMLDRAYLVAKRSGIAFNVASIPPTFNAPSNGAFDPKYMKALYDLGYDLGKSSSPFDSVPPPYPRAPEASSPNSEKTGANK